MQTPGDIFTSVTVRRYAAGSYSGGRWVEGTCSTVQVVAAVQPGSMKELMSLEEGDRTKDTLSIWSPSPLYTLDESAGMSADRVEWEGALWQVRRVESYGVTPELKHYHAICIREQAV